MLVIRAYDGIDAMYNMGDKDVFKFNTELSFEYVVEFWQNELDEAPPVRKALAEQVIASLPKDHPLRDKTVSPQEAHKHEGHVDLLMAAAVPVSARERRLTAAFSTAQRTREIGIRKTLGATSGQVISLLSRDFMKPVMMAVVFAALGGWYAASQWIQGYAYRTEIGVIQIGIVVLIMFAIALSTVQIQAWGASRANPAVSIRYD